MQNNDINLREIQSLTDMSTAREAWTRLVFSVRDTTPFQSWEWNFGLASFEDRRSRLRIVIAENSKGEVVGVAPFLIHSNGLPGLSVLEFIGSRASDYLDLVALETYKESFIHHVLDWVERNTEWNILNFRNLRRESVESICRNGEFEVRPCGVCQYANLPTTFSEYERKVLQKRLRKTIHSHVKCLDGEKRLAFSTLRTDADVTNALDVFFELHQRRQRSKGERGRFFSQRSRQVFREMSLALSQAGYVRFGILWIDGKAAACSYNFRLRDREYLYAGGMEPSLAGYSPGSLLDHWMIKEAIKEGVRVYDFMGGNESYKSRWTNESCHLFQITRTRSRIAALSWRNFECARNLVYRSRLVKHVYFAAKAAVNGLL
jgi:CelD/BcsL family acetyltransferase involved in cellulose biosynthesis